jgi:hypothetical protein
VKSVDGGNAGREHCAGGRHHGIASIIARSSDGLPGMLRPATNLGLLISDALDIFRAPPVVIAIFALVGGFALGVVPILMGEIITQIIEGHYRDD